MIHRPHTPEELAGSSLLHEQNHKLHTSPSVENTRSEMSKKLQSVTHSPQISQKPADKLASWMQVLERTHGHQDRPEVMDRLKQYYHKNHVIAEEDIPESVYVLEQRIARNMGHGNLPLTEEFRQAKAREIIHNQTSTLDQWFDYLTGPDAMYPMWAKYWAWTSMLRLGKLEKKVRTTDEGDEQEVVRFQKRKKDTVAPFPVLNPRALALTIGAVQERVEQKYGKKEAILNNTSTQLSEGEFEDLIKTTHFGQIYAQYLKELPQYSAEGLREIRGSWIRYPKNSTPDALVQSLEGHPLEWCTANPDTARTQLQGGDFYVYYSWDQEGESTIPRLAIRMAGTHIAEVRGIASNQNLDPYISPVLEEKLRDFSDGESYVQKSKDMQYLTEIEERHLQGEDLSAEDLAFLYQMDRPIRGFGYRKDPRIAEIISTRSLIEDYNKIFAERTHIQGDLDLSNLTSAEGLVLPQSIGGGLNLRSLTSAEGLTLPTSIGQYLDLSNLTTAEGLIFPQSVGGELYLNSLTSAEGLVLPQSIRGNLNLRSLTSAEGITFPQSIGGGLNLRSLTSAEGITFPTSIRGNLDLNNLTSAEGITFPQSIGGLNLSSLISAEGLVLPQSIGHLDLSRLTSAEGLVLPQSIGGNLNLRSLTSAEGITFPQSIGGGLNLISLTSAEGITFPTSIRGNLDLNNLTSAKGITFPQSMGGKLYLDGLTIAEGLIFPQSIRNDLNLSNLTIAERITLPTSIGGSLDLRNLTTAGGVIFPQSVGRSLDLRSLTSADELILLPESIGGNLNLSNLTTAEGLIFPENVRGILSLYSLISAEGLTLPTSIGQYLDLSNLTTAEGLIFPQSVGGELYLNSLTSAEGLVLPQSIGGGLDLSNLTSAEAADMRLRYSQHKIRN